jgi:hypothetical protein
MPLQMMLWVVGTNAIGRAQVGTDISYRMRVRGKKYLWGGPGVTSNLEETPPLFLTIKNDDFGETISFGTSRMFGGFQEQSLGKIEPGQTYTLILLHISGVYASQDDDRPTFVNCTIHGR